MSEEDYQRGLRGGDARVTTSEWDRWRDWKAGHDEYWRSREEEHEARLVELGMPDDRQARLLAHILNPEADEESRSRWKKIAEHDAARKAQVQASTDRALAIAVCFTLVGAVMGGWMLGSGTNSVIGGVVGAALGGFVGFFAGGLAIAIVFD